MFCTIVTKESADPERMCLFRIKLVKMNIKNSTGIYQGDCILFTILYSRQAFFSFISRFKLGDVEQNAKNVSTFLKEKQERERPLRAEKEAHVMANKLQKVKKSIEKQKLM